MSISISAGNIYDTVENYFDLLESSSTHTKNQPVKIVGKNASRLTMQQKYSAEKRHFVHDIWGLNEL